jgi:hypothetical protein
MDDYLPLSMLNQLEYCERRFFLMHVRGEMEVNAQHVTGKKKSEGISTFGSGAYWQDGSAYLNNASAARSSMGTPRTSVS